MFHPQKPFEKEKKHLKTLIRGVQWENSDYNYWERHNKHEPKYINLKEDRINTHSHNVISAQFS